MWQNLWWVSYLSLFIIQFFFLKIQVILRDKSYALPQIPLVLAASSTQAQFWNCHTEWVLLRSSQSSVEEQPVTFLKNAKFGTLNGAWPGQPAVWPEFLPLSSFKFGWNITSLEGTWHSELLQKLPNNASQDMRALTPTKGKLWLMESKKLES